MTDHITGVDLSLSCSGVASIYRQGDHCKVIASSVTSSGRRGDGLAERHDRIVTLAAAVVQEIGRPRLAVVEGPSHGSRGGSPVDRYHLWWSVVGRLVTWGIPIAVVAPATRAKFATGSGKGDKAAVAAAMCRLWPDVVLGNSDESDAVALAHIGAVRLGWPVVTLERHRGCLAAVRWPVLPSIDA